MISEQRRDYFSGALMVAIGVNATYVGATYPVGTLTRMGPGYFPVCLGVMLTVMGVLIALSARSPSVQSYSSAAGLHPVNGKPDWRGWSCIIGGVASFVILSQYAGLAPATFVCVFIGASGDRTSSAKSSAALALGITAFAILLFSYVLQVQIPIFGKL